MRHLILATELFRRANITTMYRASLCMSLACKPGTTTMQLASLLQTSRESIRVAVRHLEKIKLARTERVLNAKGFVETKIYATPYLTDVLSEIKHEITYPSV